MRKSLRDRRHMQSCPLTWCTHTSIEDATNNTTDLFLRSVVRFVRIVVRVLHLLPQLVYLKPQRRIFFLQLAHLVLCIAQMHTVKLLSRASNKTQTITACSCASVCSCSKAAAAAAAAAAKSACCCPPTLAAAGRPLALSGSLSLRIPFVRGLQKKWKKCNGQNVVRGPLQFVHLEPFIFLSFFCPRERTRQTHGHDWWGRCSCCTGRSGCWTYSRDNYA